MLKTILGISPPRVEVNKEDNFERWYEQILVKGAMIDHCSLPGYFILKLVAYGMWEKVRFWLDDHVKPLELQNVSFPILPYLGDRTQAPYAVPGSSSFPTSESVIYPSCRDWIKSHRDLPLRLNQWCIRFQHEDSPQPLLRNCEYLLQEAHAAYMTKESAHQEAAQILELYSLLYRDLLAIPVIKGYRNAAYPQDDGINTGVVVAYLPATNQCIEGAKCQEFGQTMSKAYDITVTDPSAKTEPAPLLHVWQNCWRVSIRALGVMVATHSDNHGLVLPPRIAEAQVAIITTQTSSTDEQLILDTETDRLVLRLSSAGIRVKVHDLEGNSLGWRLNEWIVSGVPLFIELGPNEVTSQVVTIRQRDLLYTEGKFDVAIPELHSVIPATLVNIQEELYRSALAKFQVDQRRIADNWDEFIKGLYKDKLVCLAPHCRQRSCELYIEGIGSGRTGEGLGSHIRCLCVPLEQPEATEESASPCINPTCKYRALKWAMFGFGEQQGHSILRRALSR
ncbi:hypothetical protein BDV27DRAFT_167590 [Aspergillus caelatus]|uniref:proline--tRNA ligase n=1 Tax=Aspergillus caelatus TaxID=61420 RepID=A0A5N7AP13_9EURO|nr:uncharacterized protein BDV27DRAFT_167590 [Aspergillus caelatus]KAE8370728.1 hypothetical protein BDV27DRAFT_167590 [Aspergillus caelatus]